MNKSLSASFNDSNGLTFLLIDFIFSKRESLFNNNKSVLN